MVESVRVPEKLLPPFIGGLHLLALGAVLAVAVTLAGVKPRSVSAHDASYHGGSLTRTSGEPLAKSSDEVAFLAENDIAMSKMMRDMTVKPTGDIDRDFVEMMVPHHQGAIEMAQAVLRYGRNEQLRRIAQEIIVGQLQEIAAMRLAVGDPLPSAKTSPTQVAPVGAEKSQPTVGHSMHAEH